jgi:hypothetical protein
VVRAEDCLQAVEAISLGARRFIVPLRVCWKPQIALSLRTC